MSGSPLAEFRSNKAILVLFVVAAVILGGIGALFLPVATDTKGKPWDGGQWFALSLLVLLPFLVAVILLLIVFAGWSKRVLIYEDGLSICRGGASEDILWTDIAAVTQGGQSYYVNGAHIFTTHSYTIRLRNGRTRSFGDLWDRITELGTVIHECSCAALAGVYIDAYNAGQSIGFGPIGISQQGLINAGRTLPWAELGDITFDPFGNLVVTQRASGLGGLLNNWFPWCKVEGHAIENPQLFMLLVNQIMQPQ